MTARVVILGGGVAGMSAAQELIERGYEVVVLERRAIAGGKARSVPVTDPGGGHGGHELQDTGISSLNHHLPGEHGFRFFPGFYRHVVDTMARIPCRDGRSVADHLVPTSRCSITQYGKPVFDFPAIFPGSADDLVAVFRALLQSVGPITELSVDDLAQFGARIWQILTSCSERRLAEYESLGWWQFIGAEHRSPAYQKFLATGITRSLVAAKARTASTRTIGDIFVQLLIPLLEPWGGATDRVLDGPTNLVWIDPWLEYLRARGVHYIYEAEVVGIEVNDKGVSGVVVDQHGGRQIVRGDYYLAALPIERIAPLLTPALVALDPGLGHLQGLAANVEWMNGVQYYLTSELPAPRGHVIHIDTEWALTSISQLPFWPELPRDFFGTSELRTVLSVDISDWTMPGADGRPAMRCSRQEVAREAWRQLKLSLNRPGEELLRDQDLQSWFLDSDIAPDPLRPGYLSNAEPLLVNLVNTWALRPEAITAIPNLFLASDYVRTHTDLATMEGANEAARRAVNGILEATAHAGPRCQIWPLHEPELFRPLRETDALRFRAGLPWDCRSMELVLPALRQASPLLDQVADRLQAIEPYLPPDPDGSHGSFAATAAGLSAASPAFAAPGSAAPADLDVGPEGFLERLSWYADQVSATLQSGVPEREPRRHLYDPIRGFLARAGKGLRPALCLATTRALGGDGRDALAAAAGIEMLHNAFLVHDDIEDESDSRRGAPTLHRIHGLPLAVNAGDAMNALAMGLFRRSSERGSPLVLPRLLDEVDHMLLESLEGQAMELGWLHDNTLELGPDDYLRLVLKKTAWYSFIHPLRIGALIANPADQNLDRFDRFGYFLGLAFQICDDVLNLRGHLASYGKEIDGDLWEGKRTLILCHALATVGASDRAWIASFLGRSRQRRLPREVWRLHQLLEGSGSIDWAMQAAESFTRAAIASFEGSAFAGVPQGPDLAWLRSCIDYLVQRDR
jgi:geranylgeranyl pyrophosphate synthase/uncharacterized protein with NAD-binding domain and iron-sulfur cluster